MATQPQQRTGFTLIELLVVISIISLLSAIVITSMQTSRDKGIDSKKIQLVSEYRNAIELYYSQHEEYPNFVASQKKCLGANNPDGNCFAGELAQSATLNDNLDDYFSGAPASVDSIPLTGTLNGNDGDYRGLGYECITFQDGSSPPCNEYALFWMMKVPGASCQLGFADPINNPVDLASSGISNTHTFCVYTNNKIRYDELYN